MLSFFASSNNSNSRQHSKIKILERARFENMNYGKLTQDIFERTVHKTIQNNSILYKNHFSGTGLGADCAILPLNNDKKDALLVTGQALAYGNDQYSAVRAMIAALNHVAQYIFILSYTVFWCNDMYNCQSLPKKIHK